jgi:hypothetical protein
MDRCTAFEKRWLKERVDWTKRLEGLNTMFDHKLKQSLNLITGVQRMADEILDYEIEENRYRAQMPAIFSLGKFNS